jgi:nucleotide-binding universal stress UspA family protein
VFNHMLVPMDGSPLAERVLPHVVATARAWDARVTVLQVCEPPRGGETVRSIDALRWHLRTAEADAYLKQVVARLRKAGIKAQPQRLEGRAAEQITAYAYQNAVDLIILSSHGRTGLTGWNVSSVVQKVLAGTLTSIMIVRAHQTPSDPLELMYSRILCPLDCSQRQSTPCPRRPGLPRPMPLT